MKPKQTISGKHTAQKFKKALFLVWFFLNGPLHSARRGHPRREPGNSLLPLPVESGAREGFKL